MYNKPKSGGTESGTQLLISGVDIEAFDDDTTVSFEFLQSGAVCNTETAPHVPATWILLDNQSTIDVFCNKSLLRNVRTTDKQMDIHCNAGVTSTNLVGDLPGYGTVWYHPQGIANILSLSKVISRDGYHVTFDSTNGNQFLVQKPDGSVRIFRQAPRGLYFMDTNATQNVALLQTVADKKSNYTNALYSRATLARSIQKIIGRPSTRTFIRIIEKNLLPNCPVTRDDILAAEDIFGPDVGSLKGKTVRRGATPVHPSMVTIPASLMERYRDITLSGDIMFINKIPFFMTYSRYIRFGTIEVLPNRQSKCIMAALKTVKSIYTKRGFRIVHLLMDNEFEPLRGDLSTLHITLNTVAEAEHVPDIERYIRTVKERTRSTYNVLPFNRMPARMIIEMASASVFWLNSFPPDDGVSTTLSPRSIVVGLQLDYTKHCQLEFGTYAQVHESHDNSMIPRTTGALALRPTGNAQGGHYFYSLTTGRRINRNHWTTLPMPAEVIDRIHALARRDKAIPGVAFADRNGTALVLDDDDDDDASDGDDSSYNPDNDPSSDDEDNDDDVADGDDDGDADHEHVPLPAADHNAYHADHIIGDPNIPIDNDNDLQPLVIAGVNHPAQIAGVQPNLDNDEHNDNGDTHDDHDADAYETMAETSNEEAPDAITPTTVEHNMEEQYGHRTGPYALRPRKPRDYSHLHTTLESTVMTQHSMKKGIKIFGEAGVDAVLQELKQLHDRKVLEPRSASDLSASEKKDALQYLMFLKQKRSGKIKGRGCADGRKQREHTNKEDASSPTVAIESVLLSCTIDAKEGRNVATVDIPGAFMQADMDEIVHLKMQGQMAELLVKLDPKLYRKHVQTEGGKTVLYVELRKALYGTLRAALLFWKKLTEKLKSWGFIINPYDWCVANKDINGKQCTILWHVDDLKISHVESQVVTEVISQISDEFGNEAPLTITRGKIHDYIGMTIEYCADNSVQITMIDYIANMLSELPPDMDGESATPAATHLFDISETPVMLSEAKAQLFHHNVAKLLFLCKRARPDIQTAVAFLCTRVKASDEDDYKKLTRVMRYLRSTTTMPLTLEADNLHIVKWWVDASYAVHPDMKSHTGGTMSLGKGAIYSTSTRQKLVTKSSTEGELVGVADVMPQILWTRYFLEAQGYGVKDSIVYQDNQSAMLLEKNGRGSSSKRTRHINIRYFFVQDRVNNGEVQIEYCPTGEMLADYFTKPLQGSIFKKFRNMIMNYQGDPARSTSQDPRSVLGNEDMNEGDMRNPKDTNDDTGLKSGPDWTTVTHKRHSHIKAQSKGKKVSF